MTPEEQLDFLRHGWVYNPYERRGEGYVVPTPDDIRISSGPLVGADGTVWQPGSGRPPPPMVSGNTCAGCNFRRPAERCDECPLWKQEVVDELRANAAVRRRMAKKTRSKWARFWRWFFKEGETWQSRP